MDPLEEFLSPEALRLLLDSDDFATTHDQPSVTTSDQSLTSPLTTAVDIPSLDESRTKRKRVASDANIPGASTLVLDKAGSAKPKRAKFSAEGRAKVASVRKKGACMRCYRNKISCSGEWPCESCCRSRAVIAGRASRHRWMDCIPFSMKDFDIFVNEIVQKDYLIDESLQRIRGFCDVGFSETWLYEEVFIVTKKSDTITGYLRFDFLQMLFGAPSMNRLIPAGNDSISRHVDSRLDKTFQLLAATSLIRLIGAKDLFHGNGFDDLRNLQSFAGSKLLQCLEKTLSNISLSKFGADTLKALIWILCMTLVLVTYSRPRFQSLPEYQNRQQQLLRVLAHHVLYIEERVRIFESIDKESFTREITSFAGFSMPFHRKFESKVHANNTSSHTTHNHFSSPKDHGKADNSFDQPPMTTVNTSRGPTNLHDQPLEKTSAAISPALDQRKGDVSQPTLYTEAETASEPKNDWGIVPSHANARSPYLPDPRPEDKYWTFSDHNQVDPATSTTPAAPLPELQPDTVCSWCGSRQVKPSQGVVACDSCLTQYRPNGFTASGWDLGEYQSTDQSFNPASGLDTSHGALVDYASRPDVATSSSYGNDLNDFSWFMAP